MSLWYIILISIFCYNTFVLLYYLFLLWDLIAGDAFERWNFKTKWLEVLLINEANKICLHWPLAIQCTHLYTPLLCQWLYLNTKKRNFYTTFVWHPITCIFWFYIFEHSLSCSTSKTTLYSSFVILMLCFCDFYSTLLWTVVIIHLLCFNVLISLGVSTFSIKCTILSCSLCAFLCLFCW